MKIRFSLETNRVGSRTTTDVDFDEEEWAELDDAERNAYVKDVFWSEVLPRLGDWDWEVLQ